MYFIIIGLIAWIALSATTAISEDETLTLFEKIVAMLVVALCLSVFVLM